MNDPYQPLFDYLDAELGVTLLQTQMQEIIDICVKLPLKDHACPGNCTRQNVRETLKRRAAQ
jgi:hypothetical protein